MFIYMVCAILSTLSVLDTNDKQRKLHIIVFLASKIVRMIFLKLVISKEKELQLEFSDFSILLMLFLYFFLQFYHERVTFMAEVPICYHACYYKK